MVWSSQTYQDHVSADLDLLQGEGRNYPTVAVGQERLRLTPLPLRTGAMVARLAAALDDLWQQRHLSKAEAGWLREDNLVFFNFRSLFCCF